MSSREVMSHRAPEREDAPDAENGCRTRPCPWQDAGREAPIRLLLVEDDPESRQAIELMLKKRGVAVACAFDAEEALRIFDPDRTDIIVSDIRMDGMNGMRLLGLVREQWPDFPVILLTGYESIESATQAVRLGAQDYIIKPLNTIEDLLGPVRKAVHTHRLLIENRLLESNLVESREFGFSLLNNSPNPIVVLNPDTSVKYVNPALEEMTGYSAAELIGRGAPYPWWDQDSALQRPDRLAALLENGLRNHEELVLNRDGRKLWAEISFVPVKHEDRLLYCVTNWVNITERKEAAEALRASREQLRALAAHIQSVRENERTRIAREIHDELGHRLAAFKMDLAWVIRKVERSGTGPDEVREKLQCMTDLADRTIHTVRKISAELRPGLLDNLGLCAAIEWQAQQFERRTGIRCGISGCENEYPLARDRATAVFRVFEEVLTNVAQHADASRVTVELVMQDEHLLMRVGDNGKGITDEQADNPDSLGLLGMRERMRMANGVFNIRGTPGQGTIIEVRIPILSRRNGSTE